MVERLRIGEEEGCETDRNNCSDGVDDRCRNDCLKELLEFESMSGLQVGGLIIHSEYWKQNLML